MSKCPSFAKRLALYLTVLASVLGVFAPPSVYAQSPNPQDGAIGIEGKIPSAPPTQRATITSPGNGQVFTRTPITVSGLCPRGLLLKIFTNNVFIGSAQCDKGSYSVQVDLFAGRNDLVARVFDAFDQAGPDSNVITVTFNDAQFNPLGLSLVSLTSNYAQRGANPGQTLTWPVILNGGTGPYALSVDWGDSKAPDLVSQQFTGTIDLRHIYDTAGVYRVVVKATDKNGFSAYLQLVAVANGAVTASTTTEGDAANKQSETEIMWLPAAACIPLVLVAFWLGKRYELAVLKKHLE